MFEDSVNAPFGVVPNRWGHKRATIASNVAVLTAVDIAVKYVYIQAGAANVSAIRVNFNAAASAVIGLTVPKAINTADGSSYMEFPVSSVTCLQFYGDQNNDVVDVVYRS